MKDIYVETSYITVYSKEGNIEFEIKDFYHYGEVPKDTIKEITDLEETMNYTNRVYYEDTFFKRNYGKYVSVYVNFLTNKTIKTSSFEKYVCETKYKPVKLDINTLSRKLKSDEFLEYIFDKKIEFENIIKELL